MVIAHYYAHIDSEPEDKETHRFHGPTGRACIILCTWVKEYQKANAHEARQKIDVPWGRVLAGKK